jgi:isochorismate hydrolase
MSKNITNTIKIIQKVLKDPMIVTFTFPNKQESYDYGDNPFRAIEIKEFQVTIVGDDEKINQLQSNIEGAKIINPNKFDENVKFKLNDLVFLLDESIDIPAIQREIEEYKLDTNVYNYSYITLEKGLDYNLEYTQIFDEDDLILKEIQITDDDFNRKDEEPVVIIRYEDEIIPIGYNGSITVISGQTGTFKTTILNNIVAAYVNPENKFGIEINDDGEGVVLIFDTESRRNMLAKNWEAYTKKSRKVLFCSLNEIDTASLYRYVNSAISSLEKKGTKIRALLFDTFMDFGNDFNNNEESTKNIKLLLNLLSKLKVPIITTYQENPDRGRALNSKMSGHLGTKLSQKCETHLTTKKTKGSLELKLQKSRYSDDNRKVLLSVETKDKCVFFINNGIMINQSAVSVKANNLSKTIDKIFASNDKLSTEDLVQQLEILLSIGKSTAKTRYQDALSSGLIELGTKKGNKKFWRKKQG